MPEIAYKQQASSDEVVVAQSEVMPSRTAQRSDTMVGAHSTLEGSLKFTNGDTRVFGALLGTVEATDTLFIEESGYIKATVRGVRILIYGRFEGELLTSEHVELFPGSQVTGSIVSPHVVIHDGAHFDGRCIMDIM